MNTDPELDLLVLGSGVAGLSAAVRAADALGLRVGVLTKAELDQAATRWAQGGVAAVLAGDPDSTDLHLADTLSAGAGLCDVEAVRVLVDEGPGPRDRAHRHGRRVRSLGRRPARARTRGWPHPPAGRARRWSRNRRGDRTRARRSGAAHRGCRVREVVRARPDRGGWAVPRRHRPRRRRRHERDPGDPRVGRDGRIGPGLRRHDEPTRVDGRRPGDGAARPVSRSPTSSSCSSIRRLCTIRRCRAHCCRRRFGATVRWSATPKASGSSMSCCRGTRSLER